MKYLILSLMSLMVFLSSCTYNVSMAHNSGSSEGVIDDSASNNPTIRPVISTLPSESLYRIPKR